MDPDSGRIYSPEEVAKLEEQAKLDEQRSDELLAQLAKLVDIPPEELDTVKKMNRHERRKWAALARKAKKKK